ncbi:amidohydrolase family protein [Shouchella sp. JSM 1781072]|uniref:amidohydrolase family protein n=1 Tax=Bacillaceae TaxID=186817 RepID=UPI0020D10824|nr:amidohydrolase family protein [Alkalihalobacillus sp. LMS6]UTR07089.1 amidohydrolase family protein [Alkalihalobacillus sp. LMS6]
MFDAHVHNIDNRFPIYENNGYTPDSYTVQDYTRAIKSLGIKGGAIVSGSFQQYDQTYLIDALGQLGEGFVGVTQLPASTTDEEVLSLHKKGVRAIRFNVNRGGSEDISHLKAFSNRVYNLVGWHTELYIHSRQLKQYLPIIEALPAVSIDHLGLGKEGMKELYHLAEKGVRVKATGFGRLDFDPKPVIRRLYEIHPDILLFGTDLPSTRAPRPFKKEDLTIIKESLVHPEAIERVLEKNAQAWYIDRFH